MSRAKLTTNQIKNLVSALASKLSSSDLKTINSQSIVGSGNITISGGGGSGLVPSDAFVVYIDSANGNGVGSLEMLSFNPSFTFSTINGTDHFYKFSSGSNSSGGATRYRINAKIPEPIVSMGAFVDFRVPILSSGGDTFDGGLVMYEDYETLTPRSFGLRFDTSNRVYVGKVSSGGTETKSTGYYTITANTWVRIGWVYTVSDNTFTGYVNGSAFGSVVASIPSENFSLDIPYVIAAFNKQSGTNSRELQWRNGIYFYY